MCGAIVQIVAVRPVVDEIADDPLVVRAIAIDDEEGAAMEGGQSLDVGVDCRIENLPLGKKVFDPHRLQGMGAWIDERRDRRHSCREVEEGPEIAAWIGCEHGEFGAGVRIPRHEARRVRAGWILHVERLAKPMTF